MAIPLLMFALALSVIIGAVACWKVRAQVVARDAIFGRRWPRNEPVDPLAPEWRVANAVRSTLQGPQVAELDHPVFQNPLIRGPWPGIPVDSEMLDHKNHERVGNATLIRSPAALGKLGKYSLNVETPLLDGKWQYWQLGYTSNYARRLRRLYDLLNLPATQGWKDRYSRAAQNTAAAYAEPAGFVLDRDDEFAEWYGRSPDFHPRLPLFCTTDADFVRERYVEPHIPRIDRGVPIRLATSFLRMYRAQLRQLELTPQLDPRQAAKMHDLKQKIEILERFLDTL
jgi:hypothetical protein